MFGRLDSVAGIKHMAKGKKSQKNANEGTPYRLTEKESDALGRQIDRIAALPAAPRVKITEDQDVSRLSYDHPNQTIARGLLMDALGTASIDFVDDLFLQLAGSSWNGVKVDESRLNFMLSVIKDLKPKDHLEAMLAAQMAVIHLTTMTSGRRFAHSENIPQSDSSGTLLIKLARTFAAQLEALKRYRTGGEQTVTVQHVNVGEGGQAIVGNVTQAHPKSQASQPVNTVPQLTDSKSAPMPQLTEKIPERVVPRKTK